MKALIIWFALALFVAFIGAVGIWVGFSRAKNAAASQKWPTTQGTIIYSQMESMYRPRTDTNRSTTSYSLDLQYTYEADGHSYTGSQIAFADPPGGDGESGQEAVREVMSQYPITKIVTVYYDPNDPATAVLEPGASSGTYTSFYVGIPALILGLGMALFGLLRWNQIIEFALKAAD